MTASKGKGIRKMDKDANIKTGDSVIVKDGVEDPDIGSLSIVGWQGRVSDVSPGKGKEIWINIKWDVLLYDLHRKITSGNVKKTV